MRGLKVGDPLDETTELGPLATEPILRGVHDQVQKSVAAGARLLTGGNRIDGPGFYYEPTVLVDVPRQSPAYREELFGPVASVFRVRDTKEAIDLANDSVFGLGASVWTNDEAEQELFASELDVGMVFINEIVASDPRSALWRSETVRAWPRTWRHRDSGIYQRKNDLDFVSRAPHPQLSSRAYARDLTRAAASHNLNCVVRLNM